MAARRQGKTNKRINHVSSQDQAYVYGNTVRQPEVLPKRRVAKEPESPKRASRQVRKNRNRATNMNPAYAMFLVAAAACAVLICAAYLNLQSDIMSRSENVSALQEELANLTEENDTAYNAAASSVNLQEVRSKAMNELGMVYASQGRVIEYENPASDYVKQYNDIPSDGVLAKSKEVSE